MLPVSWEMHIPLSVTESPIEVKTVESSSFRPFVSVTEGALPQRGIAMENRDQ